MDGGVERVAARLVGEVEVVAFGEILASLRTLVLPEEQRGTVFGVPELDALLPAPPVLPVQLQQQQHQRSDNDDDVWDPNRPVQSPSRRPPPQKEAKPGPHVLELVSPHPTHHPSQAGKTSLLHLLITHAILPPTLSTIPLSGQNAAIVLIDPLHHFSPSFLATTMLSHITARFTAAGLDTTQNSVRHDVLQCVKLSLPHVHIFRPSSWDALLATLRSMRAYLFDGGRHASAHRRVHSLVVEDLHIFVPGIRASASDAATTTATATAAMGGASNPITKASHTLTHLLTHLATSLSSTLITTSHPPTASSLRPALPSSWPDSAKVTRLAVRRVEVLPFKPGICVEEAERERAQRWDVVRKGRFEAWRVGGGVGIGAGEGFVFRVGGGGVRVEGEGEA